MYVGRNHLEPMLESLGMNYFNLFRPLYEVMNDCLAVTASEVAKRAYGPMEHSNRPCYFQRVTCS